MMIKTYTKDEIKARGNNIKEMFMKNVFIYPTDTIYGIGCNALDKELVARIRGIKKRHETPFSIIAPSLEWIYENCIVNENAEKWIAKLPGKYTFILKLKNKNAVAENVNMGETIGVRIPAHWFSEVAANTGVPIVTTSANIHGEDFMTSIKDLDEKIKQKIDFIVYEGEIKGTPSKIIDLTGEKEKIIER